MPDTSNGGRSHKTSTCIARSWHYTCSMGKQALSSHMCTDQYMNLVMQLLSWSRVWTGCVATGNGEPSGTTVAEDLESLDKDALILKLKQVGVTLYVPCRVIWSGSIALQQLGCNTHLDMNSVAMLSKADGSDTAKSVCTMVYAGSTKVHGTCAVGILQQCVWCKCAS